MDKKLSFFIVDDDPICIKLYSRTLEKGGHHITAMSSAEKAIDEIKRVQPDCVLCDLILPTLDGLQFFQRLRAEKDLKQPIFIIITSKEYNYDYRRAFEMGVNGYLNKSLGYEAIIERVLQIVNDEAVIQFWGVRGTLPVPGKHSVKYGGNTNCVSIEFPDNTFFIFDAGSGIKELARHIAKLQKAPFAAKIFITHPHWDHINGIPFFMPFYIQGNEFEIFGSNHHNMSFDKLISDQMNSVYFPVTMKEFAAKVTFRTLDEEEFSIGNIQIETTFLNHPGRCLGYRVTYKGRSFCYITDTELYLDSSQSYNEFDNQKLITFIKDADILVIDSTYSDEEYKTKIHWGHSCISAVVKAAHTAGVRLMCLYHHDPDQFDTDIDNKLRTAEAELKKLQSTTRVIAPAEGDKLSL